MKPPADLAALLGQPEYAWLIDRLAARIGSGRAPGAGVATRPRPTEEERRAIDDLLGRRSTRGKNLVVDLGDLAARFNLDEDGLLGLVEALRGPVENRRALREAEAKAWDELFSRWRQRLADHPPLVAWLEDLRATGQLKKAASRDPDAAGPLLGQAFRILVADAPHDDVLLASLAASATGDSHALDRGRPLAHLCLRAIERLHGIDGTGDADARREAWAAIGVLVDDLSAPALCLNLPPAPGADAAPWIQWHLERGEPFYLSWRQACEFPVRSGGGPVFVCENPSVVSEAARRLGASAAPLLCFNGVPSSAVRVLLHRLADAGTELRMSADFDWAGLRILDPWISACSRARPWRMSAADYRACRPVKALAGRPCRPGWASGLVQALDRSGLAAFEEERIEDLLDDLAPSDRKPPTVSQSVVRPGT